jgi:hypothetical protein
VGINARELRALQACGLDNDAILDSLTQWWDDYPVPIPSEPEARVSFISEMSDNTCADFSTWLASARIVETTEVEYQ